MKGADRYPRAKALLDRMNGARPPPTRNATSAFAVGPSILRAPPEVAVPAAARGPVLDMEQGGAHDTDEMLGELVDMVLVGADDAGADGHAEVHLVFKAEVLGGLYLRLQQMVDGMHATFVVEDAAARRAVVNHVDGLVAHLKKRGFTIASHRVELSR